MGGSSTAKATASHILVKTKEECEKIKQEIVQNKTDFATAAKDHSMCPSGKSGGSLGTFSKGQMVPPFEKVVFGDAPLEEVQGPVQTQFGYHLIVVHARDDDNEDKQ